MKRLYTDENIEELTNNIDDTETIALFNSCEHFKREKDLANYIERNIENVCIELFNDKYRNHIREFKIPLEAGKCRQGARGSAASIDFIINCEKQTYIVELKNPKNLFSEITRAIGQLWIYKYLLESIYPKADIILITTKHDKYTAAAIDKYKMPFRYIVFNKKYSAEFKGSEIVDDR